MIIDGVKIKFERNNESYIALNMDTQESALIMGNDRRAEYNSLLAGVPTKEAKEYVQRAKAEMWRRGWLDVAKKKEKPSCGGTQNG